MRLLYKIILLVSMSFCLVYEAVAADDENSANLSLNDALQIAYDSNPDFLAARSEFYSVSEGVSQAMSGWRPTVSVDGSVMFSETEVKPDTTTDDGVTTRSVEVSATQPLYLGGKTTASVNSATNLANAQYFSLNTVEQNLMRNVAVAYLALVQAKAIQELANNNYDVISKRLEATKLEFEVGNNTRTDVSQAQARLADAKAYVVSSGASVRDAAAGLERLIGQRVEGGVSMPETKLYIPASLDDATTIALEMNPQLKTAEYGYLAAKDNVDVELSSFMPQINFAATWTHESDPVPGAYDETDYGTVGVYASIPLYSAGLVSANVRQAKYDASKNRIMLDSYKRQVVEKVTQSWNQYESAKAEIEARELQVEASTIAREGVYSEKEMGTRSVLDTLDADQELLDAKVALVEAKTGGAAAGFELANAIGALSASDLKLDAVMDNSKLIMTNKWKFFGTGIDEVVEQW